MMLHKSFSREAGEADEGKLGCDTGNPPDLSLFRSLEVDDVVDRVGAFNDPGTTTIDF